ncbi:peptidoglycan-binding protein, partial [Streptomyces echinoruber]
PSGAVPRRTGAVLAVLVVAAAALVGFGAAALLPPHRHAAAAAAPHASTAPPAPNPTTATATATATATVTASVPVTASASAAPADPDGAGTLRRGDTGPQVADLQQRLLRVPDVYTGGSTDGRYDAALEAAVARFQEWYGIVGDETGVYGDDTRRALESRT